MVLSNVESYSPFKGKDVISLKTVQIGFGVSLAIVLCVLIAIYSGKSEGFLSLNQPGIFKKNIKVAPGNCTPYSGCFYPSHLSNPVSLKSGRREAQPLENEIWCEEAWRDCNIYQDCVNGQCKPKKNYS